MLVMDAADAGRADLTAIDLTTVIGTEIQADKATLLDGSAADRIRELLEQRGVIVIREIGFDDQEQVQFTRTLGRTENEGEGGIYKVTLDTKENAQAEYLKGAFYWHIDGTMSDTPILASILSGRRLSPTGGETEFCNTYAAYEDLSDEDKALIASLRVVHAVDTAQLYWNPEPTYAEIAGWQRIGEKELPMVWTHASGRKSLVLGATASYVKGMDPAASRALLVRMREFATQPKYVYQHKWSVGDLVMWDNTGTMHRAMHYDLDSGRMMHRTKLQGEESVA